jgi:hypothetical protein
VTCLTVVGNQATIGGAITASRTSQVLPGQGALIYITDNGEGNDDPPDMFDIVFTATPPLVCPTFVGGVPITQGNFIVRDAVP